MSIFLNALIFEADLCKFRRSLTRLEERIETGPCCCKNAEEMKVTVIQLALPHTWTNAPCAATRAPMAIRVIFQNIDQLDSAAA